jgi:hypothetical protein
VTPGDRPITGVFVDGEALLPHAARSGRPRTDYPLGGLLDALLSIAEAHGRPASERVMVRAWNDPILSSLRGGYIGELQRRTFQMWHVAPARIDAPGDDIPTAATRDELGSDLTRRFAGWAAESSPRTAVVLGFDPGPDPACRFVTVGLRLELTGSGVEVDKPESSRPAIVLRGRLW